MHIRIRPPEHVSFHVSSTETALPAESSLRATSPETLSLVLTLPKKSRIHNATEALLNTMRESTLFDEESLEQVCAQFSRLNVANVETETTEATAEIDESDGDDENDEDFTEMTEILCNLVVNVIRPAMLELANHMNLLDRMLTFNDQAEEILEMCIPETQDVEGVLQEYQEYAERSDQAMRDLREAEVIAGLYDSAMSQVTRSDENALALARDLFNKKKNTLLNQNRQRQEAAEGVNRTLDTLTERVDRMGEQLATSLVALGQEMDTEHASRQRLVGRALALTEGNSRGGGT